jgi:hypothetical protein
MTLAHELTRIQKSIDGYTHVSLAGQRNQKICAKAYWAIDRLTRAAKDDSELSLALKTYGEETENLFRCLHSAGHRGHVEATQRQANALAKIDRIVAAREAEHAREDFRQGRRWAKTSEAGFDARAKANT